MIKKKSSILIFYFLFLASILYVFFDVDLYLKFILLISYLIVTLSGFHILKNEKDLFSKSINLVAIFFTILNSIAFYYIMSKVTSIFSGLTYSFIAGFMTLISFAIMTKSYFLSIVSLFYTIAILTHLQELEVHNLLIFIFLLSPLVSIIFIKSRKKIEKILYFYIFFAAVLLNPFLTLINNSVSNYDRTIISTRFGKLYDPLVDSGVLLMTNSIKNEISKRGGSYTVPFFKVPEKIISGKNYFKKDMIQGTVQKCEVDTNVEKSIFIPDVLSLYYGMHELPFEKDDVLKIKLKLGLLGNWFRSSIKTVGKQFNFYRKWFHNSGIIKFLVTGSGIIHYLQIEDMDNDIFSWIVGINKEGKLIYKSPVYFEPIGIIYNNGPIIYGKSVSDLDFSEKFIVEFRNNSGEVKCGISFGDRINSVISGKSDEVIVFHGNLIEIINVKKESIFQISRDDDGPVIAAFDGKEFIYFIEYNSNFLKKIDIKNNKLINLGECNGDFISLSGNNIIIADYKGNSIFKLKDDKLEQINGIYKGISFIYAMKSKFLAGFREKKLYLFDYSGVTISNFSYDSTLSPEKLDRNWIEIEDNSINLLNSNFKKVGKLDSYINE